MAVNGKLVDLMNGAYITEVEMNSPAMEAGIQKGDVLVQIDDRSILSLNEYIRVLMDKNTDDTIEITIMRLSQDEYKEMKFQVVLE